MVNQANRVSARLASIKVEKAEREPKTKVQIAIERARAPRHAQNRLRNICRILDCGGHNTGDAESKLQDALHTEAQKRTEELALEIHTDMGAAREAASRLAN